MTKEEYIAKHGEEAYKAHLEIMKERYKLKREEILSKNKERYKTGMGNDDVVILINKWNNKLEFKKVFEKMEKSGQKEI